MSFFLDLLPRGLRDCVLVSNDCRSINLTRVRSMKLLRLMELNSTSENKFTKE